MRTELLFIGTELLLGQIVNTNAVYLGQNLARLGVDVYHSSVVGDNIGRISDAVKLALSRSDLLIVSGGLGPTEDDVTREGITDAIGRKLVFRQDVMAHIEKHFERVHIEIRPIHRKQAYVFAKGCKVINNMVGSAPGMIVEVNGKHIITMPGVPSEMKRMCEDVVFDWIAQNNHTGTIKSKSLKICGLGESTVAERMRDIWEGLQNPTVAYLARPGEVTVRITAKAKNEAEAEAMISEVEEQVRDKLGTHVYGFDQQTLEVVTGVLLDKHKKTVAIVEACTGGWIASRLTDVCESCNYFNRGLVICNERMATTLLNVPEAMLNNCGLVNAAVTEEMAKNMRILTSTDYAIAVTGIMDVSEATHEKPVGLAYIALASEENTQCVENRFLGERQTLKQRISQAALDMLRRELLHGVEIETGGN